MHRFFEIRVCPTLDSCWLGNRGDMVVTWAHLVRKPINTSCETFKRLGRREQFGRKSQRWWQISFLISGLRDPVSTTLFFFFFKILFIYLWGGEREGEKHPWERETLMGCFLLKPTTPARASTENPASNWTPRPHCAEKLDLPQLWVEKNNFSAAASSVKKF